MPIPKPNKGEDKKKFIPRCISQLKKIDPERSKSQVVAICFDSWAKNKKNE